MPYEIKIVARGEGIVYEEDGNSYNFSMSNNKSRVSLYAYSYWDGELPHQGKTLSKEESKRIIPRIVKYLESKDASVTVKWKEEAVPLKTSLELFRERRR